MAEALVVVCDVCGEPATDTVSIKVRGKSRQQDLCTDHVAVLLNTSRPAVRGRPTKKGVQKRPTARRKKPVARRKPATRKKPVARKPRRTRVPGPVMPDADNTPQQ